MFLIKSSTQPSLLLSPLFPHCISINARCTRTVFIELSPDLTISILVLIYSFFFQVEQRDVPGIDSAYLAMDTEEGVEVGPLVLPYPISKEIAQT